MQTSDTSLKEVKATVGLVAPIVVKIKDSAGSLDDEDLNSSLNTLSDVLDRVWDDVDDYIKGGELAKFASAGSSVFSEDLDSLRKTLDALSFILTGQTFVAVLRTEGKVDDIALGVYATQQAVQGMAAQVTAIGKKKSLDERRTEAYVFLLP